MLKLLLVLRYPNAGYRFCQNQANAETVADLPRFAENANLGRKEKKRKAKEKVRWKQGQEKFFFFFVKWKKGLHVSKSGKVTKIILIRTCFIEI